MRRILFSVTAGLVLSMPVLAAPPSGYKIRIIDSGSGPAFRVGDVALNNRGNLAYDAGGAVFWSEATGTIRVPQAPVSGTRYFNDKAFNDNDVLGGMLYQGDGFTGPRGLGYTWSPTEGHKLYRYYSPPLMIEDPAVVTAGAADGTPIGGYARSTSNSGSSGYWNVNTGVYVPFANIIEQARVNNNGWVGSFSNKIRNLGTGQTVTLAASNAFDYVSSISDANLVYTRTDLANDVGRNRVFRTDGQLLWSDDTPYLSTYRILDSIARDQMALKVADFPTGSGLDTTYLWNHLTGGIALSSLANDSSLSQFTEFRLTSLNESYQIAGSARALNGSWYVVILDPVPEPASILALTAGLAGLLRRRKQENVS